jgi:hypothetical protein
LTDTAFDGELTSEATHKKFLSVRREGKRDIRRELDYYNLDMIVRSFSIANP